MSENLYLGVHFPSDDPPGWYWGKQVQDDSKSKHKSFFWVNFTEEGLPYDDGDDVQVIVSNVQMDNYQKTWAIVAPNDFMPALRVEAEE